MEDSEVHLLADGLEANLFVGIGLAKRVGERCCNRLDQLRREARLSKRDAPLLAGFDLDGAEDVDEPLCRDDRGMIEALGLDPEALHVADEIDLHPGPVDDRMAHGAGRAAARDNETEREGGKGGEGSEIPRAHGGRTIADHASAPITR